MDIVPQHIITVREYMEQGYTAKVNNGECVVYWIEPVPDDDMPPHVHKDYWQRAYEFGNEAEIISGEHQWGDYFYMRVKPDKNGWSRRLGMGGKMKLLVFTCTI